MVLPAAERLEHALLLLGAGATRVEHGVERAAGHDDDTVAVADDPVARSTSTSPTFARRRSRPACVFDAPRNAIMRANTGKPRRSNAATSRTPPSMTSPAMPRACAPVVSTSPQ